MLRIMLLIICSLTLCACQTINPPSTAKNLQIKQYLGRWYEIAAFPNYFEKGCRCGIADYTLDKNHHLYTNHRCIKNSNKHFSGINARLYKGNSEDYSKLHTRLIWLIRSNYWILYVSPNYRYALVGTPSRRYLWVIARNPHISNSAYSHLTNIAKEKGFDIQRLQRVKQNCSIKDIRLAEKNKGN